MELFYNPERMTEREIKETFVAHQWLVDEIISILKSQPDGPGVQHVVIVAPRGMGKTTMLLMLRFTVLGEEIGQEWQPVLFPEESYDVYELADLWLAVLNHIAAETKDSELQDEISTITTDASHLEENALARIKNWRARNGKRLMLLIDNFDMILDQIGDERENARLRDVLMNDGTLMLVGGGTTFFKEARAYEQPLYNLFKIHNLNNLDSNQIRDLLRRRAQLDELKDFDERLRANESRIRVLEYFTGGNPRLALMLYRIITHSDISEVRRGLEKLLDEVTPYYKAKIEALPAQQRKILDQIARSTSRTREGMTPTEIATETRLPVNQISAQLKRLSEAGYVHTANVRARNSYYTLSEPLYAIWHQMRFGRDARKRMNWLVMFLKNWYDSKELGTECERLQDIFRSYMSAGRRGEAHDTLEYSRYLIEAIADSQTKVRTLENIVLSYLELRDVDTLKKDVLIDVDITLFSEETQQRLSETGLVSDERVKLSLAPDSSEDAKQAEVAAILKLGAVAVENDRMDEAKERFQQVLNLDPPNLEATMLLAAILADEGNTHESSKLLSDLRLDVVPESYKNPVRFTKAFLENRFDDALRTLEEVLKAHPDFEVGWHLKAQTLQKMSRLDDALAAFDNIAEDQRDVGNWCLLADILADMNRNEEALGALDRALLLAPESLEALRKKGFVLSKLERYDEALLLADRIFSRSPDSSEDWLLIGLLLLLQESPEKALARIAPHRDSDKDNWLRYVNNAVRAVALAGHWSRARELITVCHLEEELFPLARALDYLQTNDDALIEKLSPDVRQIVIEIITTLRPKTPTLEKQKKLSKKSKVKNKST